MREMWIILWYAGKSYFEMRGPVTNCFTAHAWKYQKRDTEKSQKMGKYLFVVGHALKNYFPFLNWITLIFLTFFSMEVNSHVGNVKKAVLIKRLVLAAVFVTVGFTLNVLIWQLRISTVFRIIFAVPPVKFVFCHLLK